MKKVLYPFLVLLTGLTITGSSLSANAATCTILPKADWDNKCSTVCKQTNRTISYPRCTEDCMSRINEQCKDDPDGMTETKTETETRTKTSKKN